MKFGNYKKLVFISNPIEKEEEKRAIISDLISFFLTFLNAFKKCSSWSHGKRKQ